jgi:tungstate transport system substrate-binding protein
MCIALVLLCACGGGEPGRVVLGATHTIEDSGLLDVLMRAYESDHATGPRLSVVVAGSGEILAMAARGDVDVVLSHSPAAELALAGAGDVESRQPVMYNTFVLAGPPADPAGVRDETAPAAALARIAATGSPFVSRGDDSGTHQRERALWAEAGLQPEWPGYVEAGTGMADALRLAAHRGAYVLTDRATFDVLADDLQLAILFKDDAALVNQYSVMVATRTAHPADAQRLVAWLTGHTGPDGRPLFVPGSADRPR